MPSETRGMVESEECFKEVDYGIFYVVSDELVTPSGEKHEMIRSTFGRKDILHLRELG